MILLSLQTKGDKNMTKDEINNSLAALREFEAKNPKIFKGNGKIRFGAILSWKIDKQKPVVEDGIYVCWSYDPECYGCVILEENDEKGEWVEFWRFTPKYNHNFRYNPKKNTLVISDPRDYMELTIEADISAVELVEIQKNVN